MNENSIFDINRIQLLLIRQLRLNTQSLFIGFGAITGVLTFILSLVVIFGSDPVYFNLFFGLTLPFLFLGGYIFTSTIFSELRTSHRGYLFLTLPASTLEKLLVSWLISSIMYMIVSIIALFVINVLIIGVALIFNAHPVTLFNLFDPDLLKIYGIFLVTQPIFLLGAIYFRGANFLKTLLALFVLQLIISFYTAIAARLIVFHDFSSIHFDNNSPEGIKTFIENTFVPVVKVLFWYCMAPFFLVVSYFRLKERQV
jgi:hypothetical protein